MILVFSDLATFDKQRSPKLWSYLSLHLQLDIIKLRTDPVISCQSNRPENVVPVWLTMDLDRPRGRDITLSLVSMTRLSACQVAKSSSWCSPMLANCTSQASPWQLATSSPALLPDGTRSLCPSQERLLSTLSRSPWVTMVSTLSWSLRMERFTSQEPAREERMQIINLKQEDNQIIQTQKIITDGGTICSDHGL